MTNRVSQAEIEDVLSSIRRLVSEERVAPADEQEAQPAPPAPAAEPERLVLTEALRVPEPAAKPEPAKHINGEASAEAAGVDLSDLDAVWADYVAEENPMTEAEVVTLHKADVSEASEEKTLSGEELSLATSSEATVAPPPEVTSDASPLAEAEVETEEFAPKQPDTPSKDQKPTSVAGAAAHTATLSAKIAALEAVIGRRRDQWEPDSSGEDAYAGTDGLSMAWDPAIKDDSITTDSPTDEVTASDDAAEAANTQPDAPVSAESSPAPLVEAVVPSVDEFDLQTEAETGHSNAHQPQSTTVETNEATVTEDHAALTPQFIHRDPEAATTPLPAERPVDQLLDEDVLRDLVSDIIREELQGVLGERITRNVRKLVRRQIQRALAAQGLD